MVGLAIPEGEGDDDHLDDPDHDSSAQIVSAMIGTGDDGIVTNLGRVTANSQYGSTVGIDGAGGVVTNDGSIVVAGHDNQALFATGGGDTVLNHGRVEMVGDISSGLALAGDASTMINEGTVAISGGYAAGMFGFADGLVARNSGTIRIDSTPVDTGGSFGASGGIQLFGEGERAENTGTIATRGDFALGIQANGGAATLVNEGSIVTSGAYAIGMAHGLGFTAFSGREAATLENSGTIATSGDGAAGVLLLGSIVSLHNDGRIETAGAATTGGRLGALDAAGVIAAGGRVTIENGVGGVIEATGASPAVALGGIAVDGRAAADNFARLFNWGVISAGQAITGGDGREIVVNHGHLAGAVTLGGGDDAFNAADGRLDGTLSTGDGEDKIVLTRKCGLVDISDFAGGSGAGDVLDVSRLGFESRDEVVAASHQVGADVFITSGGHDVAVLRGVDLGGLVADDFVFATGPI